MSSHKGIPLLSSAVCSSDPSIANLHYQRYEEDPARVNGAFTAASQM